MHMNENMWNIYFFHAISCIINGIHTETSGAWDSKLDAHFDITLTWFVLYSLVLALNICNRFWSLFCIYQQICGVVTNGRTEQWALLQWAGWRFFTVQLLNGLYLSIPVMAHTTLRTSLKMVAMVKAHLSMFCHGEGHTVISPCITDSLHPSASLAAFLL